MLVSVSMSPLEYAYPARLTHLPPTQFAGVVMRRLAVEPEPFVFALIFTFRLLRTASPIAQLFAGVPPGRHRRGTSTVSLRPLTFTGSTSVCKPVSTAAMPVFVANISTSSEIEGSTGTFVTITALPPPIDLPVQPAAPCVASTDRLHAEAAATLIFDPAGSMNTVRCTVTGAAGGAGTL